MSTLITSHINLDQNGIAWIDDSNVKVIEVVTDKIAYGSSPEEIHAQYPHLSLAQIYAALTYYYDHQAELDTEIQRRWREANELAVSLSDPELRKKLLDLKNRRTYRRHKGSDCWHWCKNCSSWPTIDLEQMAQRPTSGELCNECRSKEMAGSCHR